MCIGKLLGLIGFAFMTYSTTADAQTVSVPLLTDAGFEGAYSPAPVLDSDATVTGVIPEGWSDFSTSADVTVGYIKSVKIVHSGKAAIEINLKSAAGGSAFFGQLVNGLNVGGTYEYGIWAYSEDSDTFEIGVRRSSDDDTSLTSTSGAAGRTWHKLTGTFTAPKGGTVFFYLRLPHAGTVVFDDATLIDKTSSL